MRPSSHVKIRCDPFQAHCRLLAQPSRERHLGPITLVPALQLRLRPAHFLEFFLHDPPGFGPGAMSVTTSATLAPMNNIPSDKSRIASLVVGENGPM